jgi:predicted DNA-binding protein YlxM (UPF0122 family)
MAHKHTLKPVKPVVPMSEIEAHHDEVRARHPQVSDRQAEIVDLVIHTGWTMVEIAEHLGVDKQVVRYHMRKESVCAYRQELAMQVMGWDAALAQSTLRSLLRSRSDYVRLEAAKDLVSRAGLSQERARQGTVQVHLAFGVQSPTAHPALVGSGRASEGDE